MPLSRRLTASLALCAAALASLPLHAEENARYNQVALRAEVSRNVAHDLMHVTLYSEEQDSDPARLASQTSARLNAATGKARKVKGVTVQSGSRNSYPVYDKDGEKIRAWRERAEIRLESQDFATLSKLTAELLGELKMAGMDFAISRPNRQQNEDALIKEAVKAFKDRARLATEALGGKNYRLVSLNLGSDGFRPRPMLRLEAAMPAAMAMGRDSVQEIEAGTSEVTVSADGVIEVME